MGWREVVGEGFGPHREGEPAGLRRDIIDELTDHLDCAMRRELVAAPDERAAEQKVLARFGDPRQIARRLWLDAMKETIMSQRIMLGVVVLLAAACVAASVFAWLSFRQGQQLNQALLARLEELGSRPAAVAAVPSDVAVATFRLVEEGEGGEPVPGAEVVLEGNPFMEKYRDRIEIKTGADGLATLGPIRPGRYDLSVSIPSGFYHKQRRVLLFGGSDNEKVIVCPRGAGVRVPEPDVRVAFDWPDDIDPDATLVVFAFDPVPVQAMADGVEWTAQELRLQMTGSGEFFVGDLSWNSGTWATDLFGKRGSGELIAHTEKFLRTMPVLAKPYRLRGVSAWARVPDDTLRKWYKFGKRAYVKLSEQTWVDENACPVFEARAGVVNEWRIEIPQGLLKPLRDALARQEGQAQPAPDSSGFGIGTPVVPRGGGGFRPGGASGDGRENN